MALGFLPPAKIPEAFREIQASSDPAVHPLLEYYDKYWLKQIGPLIYSIHGAQRRTNNNVEAWHSAFNKLVGKKHPNIFEFIEYLQQEQANTELCIQQLARGEKVVRGNQKYTRLNTHINELLAKFEKGEMDTKSFLNGIGYRLCCMKLGRREPEASTSILCPTNVSTSTLCPTNASTEPCDRFQNLLPWRQLLQNDFPPTRSTNDNLGLLSSHPISSLPPEIESQADTLLPMTTDTDIVNNDYPSPISDHPQTTNFLEHDDGTLPISLAPLRPYDPSLPDFIQFTQSDANWLAALGQRMSHLDNCEWLIALSDLFHIVPLLSERLAFPPFIFPSGPFIKAI